jgi:hypothetical protein
MKGDKLGLEFDTGLVTGVGKALHGLQHKDLSHANSVKTLPHWAAVHRVHAFNP